MGGAAAARWRHSSPEWRTGNAPSTAAQLGTHDNGTRPLPDAARRASRFSTRFPTRCSPILRRRFAPGSNRILSRRGSKSCAAFFEPAFVRFFHHFELFIFGCRSFKEFSCRRSVFFCERSLPHFPRFGRKFFFAFIEFSVGAPEFFFQQTSGFK